MNIGTYFIETYGCQMNVHDSEKIAGALKGIGLSPADSASEADVIVFNTCCIRDTAEKRILGNIGDLKHVKNARKDTVIAIVGCMTQQQGAAEALIEKFPFIDIVMGTVNAPELAVKVAEILNNKPTKRKSRIEVAFRDKPEINENEPVYRTSGCNAWVNIMYGCDNFCSYCIVPYVRGRERSREPLAILSEIKSLLDEGYKEITLLGQNVNSYGNDRADGYNFASLLRDIAKFEGKFRLRFMTSHPKDFSDEIIDIIASTPNFCDNIHLPVQAGSNNVLAAMNRKYTRERYLEIIDKIRSRMPGCGITTDIMVGFPGETEDDFEDTLDLVRRVRFSNAFTFIYSPRKGTAAARMEQLPYAVKKDRITRLIALQNQITKELSEEYIGGTYEILVEDSPRQNQLCGRTESGRLVTFDGPADMVGQFVNVKVTKAKASALKGEIVDDR
ncbi:MAG: tRNA (N6-isopentenyl adenosine(37)-C2)-methylthiotransferase MiaB [Clostridiales bacterium]|jgi:tRNA-2-methylthio-N6-dimethylallyladenosine synthase|nr:tRNA (N6-isopentenyl adenosine(37)-C2)-methylthiotransferase MiaB [Clostridiales bacterium]HOK81471.1 tRNA (N6-isopentenyl adenosine(37)-C2)-methylthiotransferase MiaB [Clostridia bacterium]HOL60771.1 tRNA (N6-isopentenyl adenosine(37)-C2)-methylthiotransferase MiaB [Clostridia bacterium]HPO53346.1 tRNA (N6-isopentenyl adenosine(37)-C2)-methylthiotransferase MiaB [Clostridia bacterium]